MSKSIVIQNNVCRRCLCLCSQQQDESCFQLWFMVECMSYIFRFGCSKLYVSSLHAQPNLTSRLHKVSNSQQIAQHCSDNGFDGAFPQIVSTNLLWYPHYLSLSFPLCHSHVYCSSFPQRFSVFHPVDDITTFYLRKMSNCGRRCTERVFFLMSFNEQQTVRTFQFQPNEDQTYNLCENSGKTEPAVCPYQNELRLACWNGIRQQ